PDGSDARCVSTASANGRASLRDHQGVDGLNALPHPHKTSGEYRDESSRPGLQPETWDAAVWSAATDGNDQSLMCQAVAPIRLLERARDKLRPRNLGRFTSSSSRVANLWFSHGLCQLRSVAH